MKKISLIISIVFTLLACESDDDKQIISPQSYKILSLGDSYTIGQSVCDTCGYPEQLKDSLATKFNIEDTFNLKVIARTGWTTTNLINAINEENLAFDYDLVTLLIGVNNQFQGRPFETFEIEFNDLVNTSIALAKGDKNSNY